MSRNTLLTTTALLALALPGLAQAASCTSAISGGNPVLICDTPASDPVSDASDNLTVFVTAAGSVESSDRDDTTLELDGTNVTVENMGTISISDDRKNANAITSLGENLTVNNTGTISSGDRAIHALDGFVGGLTVHNSGTITSRRQTIRTEEAAPGSYIENDGLISSLEGRAIQVRGQGSTVINRGTIEGGEEVIEARDDFTLYNYGSIRLRDDIEDEDGTQLASGQVYNYGLIQGSDDGVDIDEGEIFNYATGRIISTGAEGAGIDVDGEFDNSRDTPRPANPLLVENAGYIEGRYAIGADEAATSEITVINSGTLYGRSGRAVDFAPGQGNSAIKLTGNSSVIGDILYGAGDDLLTIDSLTSGTISTGVIDGSDGFDTVDLASYLMADLLSFELDGDLVDLTLQTSNGVVAGQFLNFEFWSFGDGSEYSTAGLASLYSVSQVPLPAGLPLLVTAFGGLIIARRRKG